nr:uncharacterized protein LOC127347843 [Lolium perenne]
MAAAAAGEAAARRAAPGPVVAAARRLCPGPAMAAVAGPGRARIPPGSRRGRRARKSPADVDRPAALGPAPSASGRRLGLAPSASGRRSVRLGPPRRGPPCLGMAGRRRLLRPRARPAGLERERGGAQRRAAQGRGELGGRERRTKAFQYKSTGKVYTSQI